MSLSLISGSILRAPELRLRQSPLQPFYLYSRSKSSSLHQFSQITRQIRATARGAMETTAETITGGVPNNTMKLLFVEMGVGYDQHGQDVTSAAMKACKNAISSNSIPAFRRGSIPGVSFGEMKLQIKLGVPHSLHQHLDLDKVKSIFPYGEIVNVEVVDGGLICSSGVLVEEMGDKNEDCYIVNAAVVPGQPPPDSDPAVRGNASHLTSNESESDSVIGPGYNAVESWAIRFVSLSESADTVDLETDSTVEVVVVVEKQRDVPLESNVHEASSLQEIVEMRD